MNTERIVLAYSGSLATTVAIPWLAKTYGAEVVTVTLDLGQGVELANVRERALAAGAVRAHVLDAREEFVRACILPAAFSGAFAPDKEFAGIAISRPLIARRLAEVARMESAGMVAHGCADDTEDIRLLERELAAVDPFLMIIALRREWTITPLAIEEYVRTHHLDGLVAASDQDVEANMSGRVIRSGGPGGFRLTRDVEDAPADPAYLTMEFDAGVPVRTNGVEMPLVEMIESIETIAGAHGVGRVPGSGETRAESPAGVVLHAACTQRAPLVRVKLFKGICEATALEPVG